MSSRRIAAYDALWTAASSVALLVALPSLSPGSVLWALCLVLGVGALVGAAVLVMHALSRVGGE